MAKQPMPRRSIIANVPDKTRAIGYCRVSTDQQAQEGVSLAAQEQKIREYCSLMGLELVRVEVDDGYSAKTLERPALARALAELDAGNAGAIVVYKLDRLSRSVRDLLALVEERFAEGGCALHVVVERIDTVSPSGRAILAILGALGQLERENTAERVRLGLQFLKANGVVLGALPYGKARAPKGPDDRRMPVVASDVELEAVAEAAALFSEGNSLRRIAARMNEGTTKPRRSSRWQPSTVASLLRQARKTRPIERRSWEACGGCVALEISLAEHAASVNDDRTRRGTIRRKMSVKNAVAGKLLPLVPPPLPARVEITMVQGARGKRWDGDNAVTRAKGARDEIAKWLGCDDQEGKGVDAWDVRIDRAASPAIRIRVTPGEASK